MMPRQDQTVEGGQAYQAGGNINVTYGMDASQMASVMLEMAKQLQVFFAASQAKLDERLEGFRNALIQEFAKSENSEATEAFKDPDFQFVLNDAQRVFARSGEQDLQDDLVRLLVQRAGHNGKDRVAKILNHSIQLAGSFSKNEYAALAINFLFTQVWLQTLQRDVFFRQLSDFIAPFYQDLSENVTVYEYIEAQGCGNVNYVITRDFFEPLYKKYGSILSVGFDQSELEKIEPGRDLSIYSGLLVATGNPKSAYRFIQSGSVELGKALRERGMQQQYVNNATKLFKTCNPNLASFKQILLENVIGLDRVVNIWDNTPLSKMTLTAVGKTIAHSSLSSRSTFSAPLSVWVQ